MQCSQNITETTLNINEGLQYYDETNIDIGSINSQDINPEELLKYASQLTPFENPPDYTQHIYHEPNLVPVDLGYNFDVTLKGDSNSWLYVPKPGKIFIKMNSPMTIDVAFFCPDVEVLFLRAMILFDNVNEMHLPVKRCANHSATKNNDGPDSKHILKCLHHYAKYEGNEEGRVFKDRLSVVVPLENAMKDEDRNCSTLAISYEFACQNSCTSGINRKSTSIVFTLEDRFCKILGKKAVQFKCCSCPKRDAERERDGNKRKTAGDEPFPKGKRPKYAPKSTHVDIKTEPNDDSDAPSTPEDIELPKLVERSLLMPVDSMKYIFKAAFNEIAGKMAMDQETPSAFYKKLARTIRKTLEGLDKE